MKISELEPLPPKTYYVQFALSFLNIETQSEDVLFNKLMGLSPIFLLSAKMQLLHQGLSLITDNNGYLSEIKKIRA